MMMRLVPIRTNGCTRGGLSSKPILRYGSLKRIQARGIQRKYISCGMYVPSDSFGGMSPEKKAAGALRKLFTFCAVKAIMAQLEGSGRGAIGSYDATGYKDLSELIGDLTLIDPDKWIENLMKRNKMMALRVMEVRAAYCEDDFEWDMCQKVAIKDIKESNLKLMRQSVADSYEQVEAKKGESEEQSKE